MTWCIWEKALKIKNYKDAINDLEGHYKLITNNKSLIENSMVPLM